MNDRDTKTLAVGAAYLAQMVTPERANDLRRAHPEAWKALAWLSGCLYEIQQAKAGGASLNATGDHQ